MTHQVSENALSKYKSGNNPWYNYPKIPPPVVFDEKYSKAVDNTTKFATKGFDGQKLVNVLETVGKNFFM